MFVLDGPRGTGKTYTYNVIFHMLTAMNKNVQCTAWTGIASTLLPNGRTSASLFKLNIGNDSETSSHSNGRKRIVLGGDFRQIFPVIRRGIKTDLINNCIKNSYLWNQFQKFSLLDNMRIINGDANWIKFLLDVGDGVANDYEDRVTLPEGLPVLEDLVDDVFAVYFLEVFIQTIGYNKYITTEFLNSVWTPSILHRLCLNVGSVVMLSRNLDVSSGMCNSTRLIGKELQRKCILCTFATYEDEKLPFHLKRTQFPVKLAFAISINKAQGQSFGRVGLYFPEDVFAYGQT
uniref:ATP-dependent DNA helicase n=1 Tax=Caenorhabditis japonica TaxID=281687 RepID=A0A8R1ESP4_CAEJA